MGFKQTHNRLKHVAGLIIALLLIQTVAVPAFPIYSRKSIIHPVRAKNGMVAVANEYASRAGIEVLKQGGNAIDAAVTIAFVLSVTAPQAGNLGGGGFMLVHLADKKETVAINYREKAPLFAHRDLFLNEKGDIDFEKTRYSFLSAGVPGTVAGLALALKKYGTISLSEAIKPAIYLAENGFKVDERLHFSLKKAYAQMKKFPPSFETFYTNGSTYDVGDILVQPELAWTLKQIQRFGPDSFYKGPIADKIVDSMRRYGGIITKKDLEQYNALIQEPIRGSYRGYEILSMPPPSSGGLHLIQILNILEAYPLRIWGQNSAQTIHAMTESMKLAFADRSKHVGDSDFVPVPVSGLISKDYAQELRKKINMKKATRSKTILPGDPAKIYESNETNHFSVVDKYGNAVSNTYTLNFSFGSKLIVPGAGFLLNNQMDDFSAKSGEPNAYGLVGSSANAISPGKRMLSSMTPTIVMRRDKPYIITGTPGGSRIISVVTQIISNVIDHGLNIAEATYAPRVHHQWIPDVIRLEEGLSKDTIRILEDMGHATSVGETMGAAQSILVQDNILHGVVDPRMPGNKAMGY